MTGTTAEVPWERRRVSGQAVDLHSARISGSTPALVFLHGFALTSSTWSALCKVLESGREMVVFDRAGSGQSIVKNPNALPSPYSFEASVAATKAVIDAWGLTKPILVGHSAGAAIALGTARSHPDHVGGLVLCSPVLTTPRGVALGSRAFAFPPVRLLSRGVLRAGSRMFDTGFTRAWHRPERVSKARLAQARAEALRPGWAEELIEMTRVVTLPDLSAPAVGFGGPVLVVVGANDRFVAPDAARTLAESFEHGRFELVEDCGHLPQEEQPAQLRRLLDDFVVSVRQQS